jgi:hypothetical protein
VSELRTLFTLQVTRGALLRSDGVAVGLVLGGAPPWELLARAARAQAAEDYHRLLLALDAPIDIYTIDEPPDITEELGLLLNRQGAALDQGRELHAAVLGEISGYVADLAAQVDGRGKQVVWAVPSAGASLSSVAFAGLLGQAAPTVANSGAARHGLTQAADRARRLADAVTLLNGVPPPRLPEPEEIAQLIYRLADPLRARRYPLAGSLLDRVRRVVTLEGASV